MWRVKLARDVYHSRLMMMSEVVLGSGRSWVRYGHWKIERHLWKSSITEDKRGHCVANDVTT